MDPVMVEFEVRQSDLFRANTWWLLRKWYMVAMYALIIPITLYMIPTMAARGFELADVRGFIIPAMFLVVIPGSLYLSARRTVRGLLPQQRRHSYRFSDDSVQMNTGLSSATVAWEAVHKVSETRSAFYIFLQQSFFHVVPKRGVSDPAALARLRAMFLLKLGSRARVQSKDTMGRA